MNQTNLIALSIAFGFLLVSGAMYVSDFSIDTGKQNDKTNSENTITADKNPQRADTEERLVYGNPEAPTAIVEFSDFQCPFCSQLHPTLKKIVDESEGAIQWEYRHLPLPSHSYAQLAAVVSECVAELAGNDAFWNYADMLFANQKSIDNSLITEAALAQNIDTQSLEACVNGGEAASQVATDFTAARALGGSGTPYSVIVFPDGTTKPVSGSLPYAQWATILNL